MSIVARVLQVITGICRGLFIVGMVAYLVLHQEIFTNAFLRTTRIFWLTVKTQDLLITPVGIMSILILIALVLILMFMFFTLLYKTFNRIATSYSHFTRETRQELITIAVIAAFFTLLDGNFLATIFEVITFIALLLTFDYARELQTQSDETL